MGAGASLQNHEALQSLQDKFDNDIGNPSEANRTSIQFLAIRQLSLNLSNNCDDNGLQRSQSLPLYSQNGKIPLPKLTSLLELIPESTAQGKFREAKDISIISTNAVTIERGAAEPAEAKKTSLFLDVAVDVNCTLQSENSFGNDDRSQDKGYGDASPKVIMSPGRGTIQFGNIRVRENGISPLVSNGSDIQKDNMVIPVVRGVDFVEVGALGTGASGVVVEAVHVPTLTIVALKMLPVYNKEKRQHVSRELGVLYKNLTEMKLINESLDGCGPDLSFSDGLNAAVRCPNLLTLYNAFVDSRSGMVNLVVEYMDGGSLQDLVKYGGCQDEMVLADIARQTLRGLAFLHANKNVHRDIKPANILCSSTGVVKIADFGISKVMDGTMGFANSFVGTVCYMSPERIQADNYSFPSDIWSFGLTMLAVAKGRFPLDDAEDGGDGRGDSIQSAKSQHLTNLEEKWKTETTNNNFSGEAAEGVGGYWGMIRAICELSPPTPGPSFSEEFNHFIAVCLRKEPKERYTARALLFDSFACKELEDELDYKDDGGGSDAPTPEGSRKRFSRPNSGKPYDESPFSQSVKMSLEKRGSRDREATLLQAADTLVHSASHSSASSPVRGKAAPKSAASDENAHHAESKSAGNGHPSQQQQAVASNGQFDIYNPESLTVMDAIRLKHLEHIITKLIARERQLQEEMSNPQLADDKNNYPIMRIDSFNSFAESVEDDADDLFWKSAIDVGGMSPQKYSSRQEKAAIRALSSVSSDDMENGGSGGSAIGPLGGSRPPNISPGSFQLHSDRALPLSSYRESARSADEGQPDLSEDQLRSRFQSVHQPHPQFAPNSSFQRLNSRSLAPPAPMPMCEFADDVSKWDHLACQLHLPIDVVRLVAVAKIREMRDQQRAFYQRETSIGATSAGAKE